MALSLRTILNGSVLATCSVFFVMRCVMSLVCPTQSMLNCRDEETGLGSMTAPQKTTTFDVRRRFRADSLSPTPRLRA